MLCNVVSSRALLAVCDTCGVLKVIFLENADVFVAHFSLTII